MTIKTYRHCRQCRSKLRAAVENERNAFCSRDCHGRYHRRHCLVCARETIKAQSPDSRKQNFCLSILNTPPVLTALTHAQKWQKDLSDQWLNVSVS
jgi:hypothetical protein